MCLPFAAIGVLACQPSSTEGPAPAPKPVNERPLVRLETEHGDIEIEVRLDAAPISAGDFLAYVDAGLYDGEGFYRSVRPDNDPRKMGMSLIQGGILGMGEDNPPPRPLIAHELTTETGLSNTTGVVSIARYEPGTGSAGFFFINIGDNAFLDYGGTRNPDGQGYATFGVVTVGMDVVRDIQQQATAGESPDPVTDNQYLTEPVTIIRAYRVDDEGS